MLEEKYWSNRAQNEYIYKGEKLYTITAAPYYVKRRDIIIELLRKMIKADECKKIIDIGCGDGEYILRLYDKKRKYYGIDISEGMLAEASLRCNQLENVSFEQSAEGPKETNNYDMAYIVAMLAHVSDEVMDGILQNTYTNMAFGGRLCICEQTAPHEISGGTWKRRTFECYKDALEKAGFECIYDESVRIDFPIHRQIFERRIAKQFYKKQSRIECNKNKCYVFLSKLCVTLSIKKKWRHKLNGWGYIFLTAKKI